MIEDIRIPIHKKNSSTKYISNTYRGVMQNEIYCNQMAINIYFKLYVRIFNK